MRVLDIDRSLPFALWLACTLYPTSLFTAHISPNFVSFLLWPYLEFLASVRHSCIKKLNIRKHCCEWRDVLRKLRAAFRFSITQDRYYGVVPTAGRTENLARPLSWPVQTSLQSEGKFSDWLMYITMQVALSAWQPKFFFEYMQFLCEQASGEIKALISCEGGAAVIYCATKLHKRAQSLAVILQPPRSHAWTWCGSPCLNPLLPASATGPLCGRRLVPEPRHVGTRGQRQNSLSHCKTSYPYKRGDEQRGIYQSMRNGEEIVADKARYVR